MDRRKSNGFRQGPGRGRRLAFGWPGTWLFIAALAVAAILANRLVQPQISGPAVILDGDSLNFGSERVRLVGIDAPELLQQCRGSGVDVACGRLSRDHLRGLVGRAAVACNSVGFDRYGRVLARCSAGGTELNSAMVRDGWALDDGDYAAEQMQARLTRRGIWAFEFATPADWRRANPRQSQVVAAWSLTRRLLAVFMAARGWLGI